MGHFRRTELKRYTWYTEIHNDSAGTSERILLLQEALQGWKRSDNSLMYKIKCMLDSDMCQLSKLLCDILRTVLLYSFRLC